MGIVHSAFSIYKTQALQHKLNHYFFKEHNISLYKRFLISNRKIENLLNFAC